MISIIAAIGRNRELGKNNKLLWHIPEDLKRFKKLTQGHAVIMGRKTFESLGKPLPNRLNIVVTRNIDFKDKRSNLILNRNNQVKFCSSFEDAIMEASKIQDLKSKDEIFIIGGGEMYRLGLPYANKLYLTIVDVDCPEADTYFPNYSAFSHVVYKKSGESEGYKYTFIELTK